jgi:hypothetical protein
MDGDTFAVILLTSVLLFLVWGVAWAFGLFDYISAL